jgi:hypothetical protein
MIRLGSSDGNWLRAPLGLRSTGSLQITAIPAVDDDTGECTGHIALDAAQLWPFLPDVDPADNDLEEEW